MLTRVITCPTTGLLAQVWTDDDEASEKAAAVDFVPVECPACGAAHWLNWRSGRLLGEDGQQ